MNIGLIEFARTPGARDQQPRKKRSLVESSLRGSVVGTLGGLGLASAGGAHYGLKQSKGQNLAKRASSVAKTAGQGAAGFLGSNRLYNKAAIIGAAGGAGTYLARRILDKARKKDNYKYGL